MRCEREHGGSRVIGVVIVIFIVAAVATAATIGLVTIFNGTNVTANEITPEVRALVTGTR